MTWGSISYYLLVTAHPVGHPHSTGCKNPSFWLISKNFSEISYMYTVNFAICRFSIFCQNGVPNVPKYVYTQKNLKSVPKMAELIVFFVNPSKIPDELLERGRWSFLPTVDIQSTLKLPHWTILEDSGGRSAMSNWARQQHSNLLKRKLAWVGQKFDFYL